MTSQPNPYAQSYIDHYLQAGILEQLAQAEAPMRFSELKEDGLENSLFMYHLKKLMSRGVVEKRGDEGFALTPRGAQWVNMTELNWRQLKPLPRPLVQLVVRCGDALLLARRLGQLGELLNRYTFPGGLHQYGESAAGAAARLAAKHFPGQALRPQRLACVEQIVAQDSEVVSHVVSSVFELELTEQIAPAEDPFFAYEWVGMDEITRGDERFEAEASLLELIERLRSGSLRPYELIEIGR